VKAPNPTYYRQDESGTWWYYPSKGRNRTRAKIKVCAECGEQYVVATYHAKRSKFCSRACSHAAQRDKMRARGPDSWRWKGGRTTRHGYVMVYAPDHPACQGNQRKYVAEHRLVMEEQLGRLLKSSEYVHHIDGDKFNNDPENLEIIGGSEHAKRHRANHFQSHEPPHCPTCTCDQ
jgi:hypothetical protein